MSDNKFRIVYVANSEYVGGGNRSLLSMAQKVREEGHQVLVFVPAEGDFTSLLKDKNFRYHVLDHRLGRFSKFDFLLKLIQYLKKFSSYSPNIVHANDLYCYYIASFAAKILKIPLVCHIRFSAEEKSVKYYMKILPKFLIFNSFYMKSLFLKKNPRFPVSVKKEVIYNFFDPDEYYCPQMRNLVRKQWGIDSHFLVGIIGNLFPQKGHDTFLYVARELVNHFDNCRFVMAGKDPSQKVEKRIKDLIRKLNLENYILWLGYQKDVGSILAALDVLVVPSTYEPFGRVAVEGLLAGLPVVASRTGGLIEILEDAPYGFLVDPNNYDEFANTIKNIRNEKLPFPIMDNRNYAISRFGVEANFNKLQKVYNSLVF